MAFSMLQLGRRVVLVPGLTALVLAAASWLWLSWHTTKDTQLRRMRLAVKLIAAHAGNYLDSVGGQLERLAEDIIYTQGLRRPQAALVLLRRFKDDHPDLVGATIILPNGQIFASTALKRGTAPRRPTSLSIPTGGRISTIISRPGGSASTGPSIAI